MRHTLAHLLTKSKKNNGTYLIIFFVVFFIAIIISLGIKGFSLYKSSHFITNSFTILFVADDPYIVKLDRSQQKLSILHIKNATADTHNLTAVSVAAAIPIQARITLQEHDDTQSINSMLTVGYMLRSIAQGDVDLFGMNEYDVLKFTYLANKIPQGAISIKEIDNYLENSAAYGQIQDDLYELFRDPTVINERVSIAVVNATQESGLATQVSRMLENGGYNVIAIRSGNAQKSVIETDLTNSTTLSQLRQIFAFAQTGKTSNQVSDIRIVIGSDAFGE